MAVDRGPVVEIEGLGKASRDLKSLSRDLSKELGASLRAGAEAVLPQARDLAPRRTGRLAASLRTASTMRSASIRSRLPYANVIHWGGTTGRGHEAGPNRGSVRIAPSLFIARAAEGREEVIAAAIDRGIEAMAATHGWHKE